MLSKIFIHEPCLFEAVIIVERNLFRS